ncbi:hypothetical protein K469DRAFT_644645 [Zopfia rhizophila CBS 207.26]|uniref:Nucleoporin NUP53 n=1 Tax=Zopfia rhizophila CBS 207.26 TaxID=1314779 RepID=A0A6A6DFE9_9PEZI|nr:hypothetical protein K469DRAFT_644645 [Zopfia rhizophila CBS 207.26]
MQVHAVPDGERAFDSTGRRLPWAYEYADSEQQQRRIPEEKGPFGKARKRGTSRSKTSTPAKKEDQAKLDNLRVIDDIFNRHKESENKKQLRNRQPSVPTGSLPISTSAPNLVDSVGGGLAASFQAGAQTGPKDPTEVILYGFSNDTQWAAIDYYEKVSMGNIYEDYDRQPPNSRYGLSLSAQKATTYRSLSKAAIRKINEYVGGDHWIKVTFDSPEAAERACHYSPHIIQGYTVFAERYRGTGPNADRAIRASAGAQTSQTASPNTVSSTTLPFGASQSSVTVSSATATGSVPASMPPRLQSEPVVPSAFPLDTPEPVRPPTPAQQPQPPSTSTARTTSSQPQPRRSTLRIKGAKPIVLRPMEEAFLPAAPRWQQTFGSWPIIGWIVGSGHGIIGDQVPRREDGSFDSESASLYWRIWYMFDTCFGTDFCGVRELEYDD